MSQVFSFRPNTECTNCRIPIYKRPSIIKRQKFLTCSRRCYLEYRDKNSRGWCICENCNKRYRTNPAYLRRTPNNRRYCSVHCLRDAKAKYCHFAVDVAGYFYTNIGGKHIRLHRIIMEQHLGRKLGSREHINHIDRNKLNNKIENLEVLDYSEHMKLHGRISHLENSLPATCYRCGLAKRILKSYIASKYHGDMSKLRKWCCKDCHDYYTQKYGVGYKNKI